MIEMASCDRVVGVDCWNRSSYFEGTYTEVERNIDRDRRTVELVHVVSKVQKARTTMTPLNLSRKKILQLHETFCIGAELAKS